MDKIAQECDLRFTEVCKPGPPAAHSLLQAQKGRDPAVINNFLAHVQLSRRPFFRELQEWPEVCLKIKPAVLDSADNVEIWKPPMRLVPCGQFTRPCAPKETRKSLEKASLDASHTTEHTLLCRQDRPEASS